MNQVRVLNSTPSVVAFHDDVENVIQSTTDYDRFTLDPANRGVDAGRVRRLREAIDANNLLHLFPMVVSRGCVVIDGQHRLAAARELGVPIYYLVSHRMTIESAAGVAGNTAGWRAADWVHHHSTLGNPNYVTLRDFTERYPWLVVARAAELLSSKAVTRRQLTAGEFVADDVVFAERVVNNVLGFKRWFSHWKTSTFVSTVQTLTADSRYSQRQMMTKMEYLSTRLVRCATVSDYLDVINGIYNYRMAPENHITFRHLGHRSPHFRTDLSKELAPKSSQYRGVSWHEASSTWVSVIHLGGTRTIIGNYHDPESAAKAYDAKALELLGERATLNFPG